jgi:hypothetical protein
MNAFKIIIITAPALVTLNYNPEIEKIILTVNSNLKE